MKDRAGVDINIGDKVTYSTSYTSGGSAISYGEVVDVTQHTVLIAREIPGTPQYKLDRDPFYQETHRVRRPDRCILVLWPLKGSI